MADYEPDPFPYGVASFEPTSSGVLIWTRVVETEPLLWEVATDADFDNVVDGGWVGGATGTEASQLVTIDVADPSNPRVLSTTDIIGQLREGVSRKIENTIYVVSYIAQGYCCLLYTSPSPRDS